ncbi:glutamate-rich protein 3 isoform X2 [Choloepus didactylus]|uniref:glutamate-rich protein 3 isoform X2 n=1 Tax=Choloepus didactylus TaxID=27675 RepID=UPI0018A0725F|nr:glutamate-rich protein 3 isoform X2 [Choloepus didactylus]
MTAGLLAAYNSLMDKHLAGYFNNTRIRRHLLRSGLITRSGRILSEKEYKLNIMKQDHQKYIRECLAQAIFHKVLDMERYHQLEIKKKLETLAKKEQIQRFKGEHTRRFIEKNMPVLSPRPPVGPKSNHGHGVLVDEGRSSPLLLTVPRPSTAPGNMQPPIRLQPLSSNPAVGTIPKITSGSRSKTSLLENGAPFPTGGKKAAMKFRSSTDNSQGTNTYLLPNINNYLMPSPPPPLPPNAKITRENRVESWRRRRFCPITAPNGLEPLFTRDSRRIHKTSLHSNAAITMIYLGKSVHLSHDNSDFRDEIKVYQQHCGGENLCVYKGKLLEKETFQFISKRHHGFPFSLTFFLNGIQVNRLSSCCEYKHRKGSRLGGKRGYFGFVCVEKSSPCYKCIIAMGLDKKTSSQKTRKEKNAEQREELKKTEEKLRKDKEYMVQRRNALEGNKTFPSAIFSVQREKNGIREVRTAIEEMKHKGKLGEDIWEDDQDVTFKYEYEEDFEVDEEKQYENTNEEGQADDQMNGMSKSPSDDERDNLDPVKESETSSQKAPDADDNVKDEGDGCSDSELEDDKQDRKTSSSTSSRSHPYSSCSEDESTVKGGETHTENNPDERARSSFSPELSENDEPGKSHFPIVESLQIGTEDQKTITADMETKLVPIEENLENVLEEEMRKGTQVIGEGISENSSEHVSEEEKEKHKNKLWEGSTAKAQGRKSGLSRVEKGDVGQIIAGALEPGSHCHSDANPGVSSTDNGGKHLRRPEIDTGGALDENFVVEERVAPNSNKESQRVAPEMLMLEKKGAIKEDKVPQPMNADTMEEKGNAASWGKAGINEVPLREWKPTAVQPALGQEPLTEEREVPQDILSGAGEAAEGDGRLGKVELNPLGKEAARHSAGLNDDGAPEKQAFMQTVFETEKAVSKGEQDWEKVELARKAAALNSEPVPETVALEEAAMPEKEKAEREVAVSETGSEKPDVKEREEEISTDLEDLGPVEKEASKREDGSEVAILGEEKPAKESKEVMETETTLSASSSEVTHVGVSEGSTEELCREDAEREKFVTGAVSNKEDDREEMLSEELDMARERKKAERPNTPLRETKSEREEVTKANTSKDEDGLEEEKKFKEEEGETVKNVGSKEETKAPRKDTESDAEGEAPPEASELTEDGGQQREDSLKERGVTVFDAAPGFEKSLENITALRKEGEERLVEARGPENKGSGEHLLSESVASTEDEGPPQDIAGVLGAPQSELSGKAQAPEVTITATGEAAVCASEDRDFLAGPRGRNREGPFQGPEEVGVMMISQGDFMMPEMFRREAMAKDTEEEEEKESSLRKEVVKNGNTDGGESVREGMVVADEDPCQGEGGMAETATEKREVLAELKTDEGKTVENKASSFSDVAGKETWHNVDELLEKTAAEETVAGEEIELSREEVPLVDEVTVTSTPGAGLGDLQEPLDQEREAPQVGRDQAGGELEVTEGAGSEGEESGAAGAFRLRLSPESQSELSRKCLQSVQALPTKPDSTETQEKQVQRESEKADVSVNNTKA